MVVWKHLYFCPHSWNIFTGHTTLGWQLFSFIMSEISLNYLWLLLLLLRNQQCSFEGIVASSHPWAYRSLVFLYLPTHICLSISQSFSEVSQKGLQFRFLLSWVGFLLGFSNQQIVSFISFFLSHCISSNIVSALLFLFLLRV